MIYFKNRRELIYHLNTLYNGMAVEVGVRDGHFSKFILDNTSVKKLYAIDPWENNKELSTAEESFKQCKTFLEPFGERAEMVKGYSPSAAGMFEDESLDFVYIDGLHDYESVKADIEGFYPKVKKGGIIAGHDYNESNWPDVFRAVNEFIKENGLELNITGIESPDYGIEHDGFQQSWWAYKK